MLVPVAQVLGATNPAIVCVATLLDEAEIAINLALASNIVTVGALVYPVPAVSTAMDSTP